MLAPVAALVLAATAPARGYDGPRAIEATDAGVPAAVPRARPLDAHVPVRRAAPTPPAPPPLRAHGRVHPRWLADGALTAGTLVPAQILARVVAPRQPLLPIPSGRPDVGRIDALALDRFSAPAATASDVLLALTMATIPTVSLLDGAWAARRATHRRGHQFARGWLGAALVQAEAAAITNLVTELTKSAVARHRPFTAMTRDDVPAGSREAFDEALADADRSRSFPSGHASMSFAAITAVATTLTIEHPRTPASRAVVAIVWVVGLAAASTTAALRVVAGKHYPSDVLAGAALGTGLGAAVPLLHTRWRRGRHRAPALGYARAP